jgi:hypothetical protein
MWVGSCAGLMCGPTYLMVILKSGNIGEGPKNDI